MVFFLLFPSFSINSQQAILEHFLARFVIVAILHYLADLVTDHFQVTRVMHLPQPPLPSQVKARRLSLSAHTAAATQSVFTHMWGGMHAKLAVSY
jgi:hypothetical protein